MAVRLRNLDGCPTSVQSRNVVEVRGQWSTFARKTGTETGTTAQPDEGDEYRNIILLEKNRDIERSQERSYHLSYSA